MSDWKTCTRCTHKHLDEYQHEAVHLGRGNYVLAAAAGSGKTAVVTYRIEQLIQDGVDPNKIGAFTFAKDAAGEMQARMVNLGLPDLRIGTLHSLCYEILRQDGEKWGGAYRVDDRGELAYALKSIINKDFKDRDLDPGVALSIIGIAKANCLTLHPELACEYKDRVVELFKKIADKPWLAHAYAEAWARLEEVRVTRGLIDFDDMLVYGWLVLAENELVRMRWAQRFDYVLLDEGQDSSTAQNKIAEYLTETSQNLMIIGDVVQSVYQWRAAKPEEFVAYAKRFTVHRLPVSYRLTKRICTAATTLVQNKHWNVTGPTLPCPSAPEGADSIVVKAFDIEDDEAQWIGEEIQSLLVDGVQPGSIAVLYRVTSLLYPVERALLTLKIPYVVWSGPTLYSRKEVRDLLAYLRVGCLRDPTEEHVKRAIHAPFRYLGKVFIEDVEATASANKISFLDAITQTPVKRSSQARSANEFYEVLREVNRQVGINAKPLSILTYVLHKTRYIQYLQREAGTEGPDPDAGKAANVQQLLHVSEAFKTAPEFLDYIDEMERVLSEARKDKKPNAVVLSSIHKFKGLERDYIFGIGCNEGCIPHVLNPDIDEELRLFYVMLTRAKKRFHCSWNKNVITPSGVLRGQPSRFIRLGRLQEI